MVSGNVRKDVNSRAGNIDRTFPVATVLLTSLWSPIAHHSPKSQTPWIGRDKGLREDNDLYSLAGRPCGQGSNFLQSALPIKGNRGSLHDGGTNALYLCCHSFFSCYLLSFEETCSVAWSAATISSVDRKTPALKRRRFSCTDCITKECKAVYRFISFSYRSIIAITMYKIGSPGGS